jgi:hypothetical protein
MDNVISIAGEQCLPIGLAGFQGCRRRKLYRLLDQGKLRTLSLHFRRYVPLSEIERLKREHGVKSAP